MRTTHIRWPLVVLLTGMMWACGGMQCQQAQEIIIDNRDPGFSVIAGTWDTQSDPNGNGFWGPDFRYHFADQVDIAIARFTPEIIVSGSYTVYTWWSADPDRTTDQPVIVHDANGNTTYHVNLQQHGNQWFLLGTHTFSAGSSGYIEFNTNTADGYCNADAVRLVPSL